jgi:lipoprotein NlpI
MRIAVVASCAAALSADLAAPAVAQTYETLYRACYSSGLPERVIASCSALISRRLAVGQDLATAFKNRCNAYDDNGDHIRAIADFGAALAINAEDADAFNSRGTTLRLSASMTAPFSTSTRPRHSTRGVRWPTAIDASPGRCWTSSKPH